MKDIAALRKHLDQRRETLRQIEQKHESQWHDLRAFVNPFRGRFSDEKPDDCSPSFTKILDGTPLTALRMLSAGMQSGLTSPSRQWFKLTMHDAEMGAEQSVQEWCDEVQRRMLVVMAGSGFYKALHTLYEEVAIFGTGCCVILPDYDHVISCQALTAGTYYIGRACHDTIDSFYRDMWMSAGEIVSEFGEENCSDAVRSALGRNRDHLFRICHAIEPDTMGVSRHEYMSVYWEMHGDSTKVLRIGGYDSFPVMCPRWTAVDGDLYGYGPASEALPDIKTLMKMKADFLQGLNKQVNPPVVASRQVLMGGVKTMPGGITYVDGNIGPMVSPLYAVNVPLQEVAQSIEQYKSDIRRALYVDLFMMLSDQTGQMTAREVAERHEEKMLALGPVLESLEWELLIPAIDRVFDIMNEAHLIPQPPEEIEGQDVKIEFVSILAQAQKMMGLSAVEQSVGFAGQIAQVDPTVLDVVDTEKILRKYVDMVGAPADILREEEEVSLMRQQRAEQQQQAQEMAQAQQMAQAGSQVAQGAHSLAETEMSNGGSALDMLLGGVAGESVGA